MLGFGLAEEEMLSDFERLLLKIASGRISVFIQKVTSQIEMDQLMIMTGHKLRRTHGDISGGLKKMKK